MNAKIPRMRVVTKNKLPVDSLATTSRVVNQPKELEIGDSTFRGQGLVESKRDSNRHCILPLWKATFKVVETKAKVVVC